MTIPRRLMPEGLLALDERAFGMMLMAPEPVPETVMHGNLAVVAVRGPLEHHATQWGDSYESIAGRVSAALTAGAEAIALVVDSPGGLVAGAFDASRKLRAMCQAAGAPLYAYIAGTGASAGYAIASAAERIIVSSSATVGSIGVIRAHVDVSEMKAAQGMRVTLIKSGARKDDADPDSPLTDEARLAQQQIVDAMAEEFFALVAEHRGLDIEAIRALEAGLFVGARAVELGLADAVGPFDSLLALASGQPNQDSTSEDSMDKEEEARKALQAILDDEDADEKSKAWARSSLKSMDEDNDDKSESGDNEDKEDKDESKAAAPAASAPTARGDATGYAAELQRVSAKLNSLLEERDSERREELLASRPDITDQLRATLSKAPVEEVEQILAGIPAPKRANPAAASTTVQGTRGAQQGTPGLSPDQNTAMDRAMGLQRPVLGVKREGNRLQVGAIVDWKG